MQPFQNFTVRAQEAVKRAHELAIERGQNNVDVLHLLVALTMQEESVVISMLERLEIDIDFITDSVVENLPDPEGSTTVAPSYQIYLTPELAKVLEVSHRIAVFMKDEFVSTEHLFLAILEVPSKAKDILEKFKIEKETILKILKELRESKITDSKSPEKFRLLTKYTRNLTEMAREDKLDPVVGREVEVRRLMQVLSRRTKNNPVLIGEAGVGKTAIAEGLAQRIAKDDVPDSLRGKEVISLDLGLLLAGTKYRGEFEERLRGIMKEIEKASGKIILFIDELHTLVGAGNSDGAMDASNMLKPALARGELRAIGATTIKEYQKHIEKDAALTRRFQPIYVNEPSVDDSISMLRGLKDKYELHHGVRITDEAICAAVNLSSRYVSDRFLPDKAIDLIDEAASALRLQLDSMPEELEITNRKIMKLEIEKEALKKEANLEGNAGSHAKKRVEDIQKEISDLKEKISALELKWKNEKESISTTGKLKKELEGLRLEAENAERQVDLAKVAELRYGRIPELEKKIKKEETKLRKMQSSRRILKEEILEEDIAAVVARWTGIPAFKMLESEAEKLVKMEDELEKNVKGQREAIEKIANAVRRSRAGISYEDKPIGSFMFLGQTGVGKTELAKTLAKFMFNDEKALIRVDMSEFMEKHSVSKIIGAPAGYVGYEEGGQLTEKVRHRPYSIILFDEIEKAHREVFNILLQVLDNGRLTDAKGRSVNFKNTIIIMTSNIGSEHIQKTTNFGFATGGEKEEAEKIESNRKDKINKAVEAHFRPEFLNRLDEIIVFNGLTPEVLEKIVLIQADYVVKRLREKEIGLKITSDALSFLAKEGYNPTYGARPLKRLIQDKILNQIANFIVSNQIKTGGNILVTMEKDSLVVSVVGKNGDKKRNTKIKNKAMV